MNNLDLSGGIIAFVGWDTDAALPGRHPERIQDLVLRERVLEVIAHADSEEPGSQDLWEWGKGVGRRLGSEYPELSQGAIDAIVALITFEWR